MGRTIRTKIIKVGNSQGICIPKILLDQSGIKSDVDIEVQGDSLIIRSAPITRQGWDAAFARMAKHQDDRLLDEARATDWEQD